MNTSVVMLMYWQEESRSMSSSTAGFATRVGMLKLRKSRMDEVMVFVSGLLPVAGFPSASSGSNSSSLSSNTSSASQGVGASLTPFCPSTISRSQASMGSFSTMWGSTSPYRPVLPAGGYWLIICVELSENWGPVTRNSCCVRNVWSMASCSAVSGLFRDCSTVMK